MNYDSLNQNIKQKMTLNQNTAPDWIGPDKNEMDQGYREQV